MPSSEDGEGAASAAGASNSAGTRKSSERRRMGDTPWTRSTGGWVELRESSAARRIASRASRATARNAARRRLRYPRPPMATRPYETLTEAEWTQVDKIHDLLDDGDAEAARRALDELLRRRPDHPDLR